ncbi:MAG: tRNA-binding protein [Bacteroidales bacterium]|nr:tRNA-binding protein [Bacteroidales bacterium]
MIDIKDFDKVDIRIGTVVNAVLNPKAKKPAYKITVDFGGNIGVKTSSAQITSLYTAEELTGKQVVCVINLPPRRIADVKSEILILGCQTDKGVVILQPQQTVENGSKVF